MRNDRPTRSPFDSAAIGRLRRMGLVLADGSVDRDAMTVFCRVFAGQFYDDLRDYHRDDTEAVSAARRTGEWGGERRATREVPDDLPAI